jgi:asparagine synthetase B (glutamine-hydrolysing)
VIRLPAGAAVSVDRASGRVTVVEQRAAYANLVPYSSPNDAADALWDDYRSGLAQLTRVPGCAGMMMSGGFDTRLVAMGLASSQRPVTALTFGDDGNFEVRIAERVARMSNARWKRRSPTEDLDSLSARLPRLIALAESANFPSCDSTGEELVADGATTFSTGYGGETVIGGQGSAQFLAASKRSPGERE